MPWINDVRVVNSWSDIAVPTTGSEGIFGQGKFGQARYGKIDAWTRQSSQQFSLTSARADEAVVGSAKSDMISQNYIPVARPDV